MGIKVKVVLDTGWALESGDMAVIDPQQFLEVAQPALAAGDAEALARRVTERWRPRCLCALLRHADEDVRRVAAVTLGLVGDDACIGCLARALHDPDTQVNEMAEHGLWSIWFRSCKPEAALPFEQGIEHLGAESYQLAIDQFREAIHVDPGFAEAYDQCGIARFFLGQWRDSIEDYQQALLRQPAHFGAMAGMGHAYAHLGELQSALDCYRRAVAINPRMTAINRAIKRLERELESTPPAFPHLTTTSLPPAAFRSN